jgi:hypothetical protein
LRRDDGQSSELYNFNEIIYSVSPVHPGSWKGIPSGFQDIADVRICPNGQLRRFGLNFNEINTSRNRRLLCIQQAWARAALEILGPYLNVIEIK